MKVLGSHGKKRNPLLFVKTFYENEGMRMLSYPLRMVSEQ